MQLSYAPKLINSLKDSARSCATRANIGTSTRIFQHRTTTSRNLKVNDPALLFVTAGRKIIHTPEADFLAEKGTALLLPIGLVADITNEISRDHGYAAQGFYFAPDLLPLSPSANHAPSQEPVRPTLIRPVEPGLLASLQSTAELMADPGVPDDILAHKAREILLWLRHHGLEPSLPRGEDLARAVRKLLESDLSRNWLAPDIAKSMAMSEATLRRKLARSGHSLSEILAEARMACALNMLQSSNEPITQIAFCVGYDSPSHFASRFRRRFGFAPSQLR